MPSVWLEKQLASAARMSDILAIQCNSYMLIKSNKDCSRRVFTHTAYGLCVSRCGPTEVDSIVQSTRFQPSADYGSHMFPQWDEYTPHDFSMAFNNVQWCPVHSENPKITAAESQRFYGFPSEKDSAPELQMILPTGSWWFAATKWYQFPCSHLFAGAVPGMSDMSAKILGLYHVISQL